MVPNFLSEYFWKVLSLDDKAVIQVTILYESFKTKLKLFKNKVARVILKEVQDNGNEARYLTSSFQKKHYYY